MFGIFLTSWALQARFGFCAYNNEQRDQHQATVTFGKYLTTAHFLEATGENWESEFLQMGAFIWFGAFLFQKGSPESNDPYEEDETAPLTKHSPWPARKGGWVLAIYSRSLTLAFLLMFLVSFVLHAIGGAREYSDNQVEHGHAAVTVFQFLGRSEFWFQSFQNWQSEFLAIFAMVVLAIWLRQKGSPESKPVNAPHHVNE
ncbi:MAG: hypothetical protein H7Z14_18220 [Anaerolineae bacterium]|nr:hypothetical protein [Phycisphaerae bacterium]